MSISIMMQFYKAISVINDNFFSLGMGGAKVIHLPCGRKIDGGKFGIYACTTEAAATRVIKDAKRRTQLPVPPNMQVIIIVGRPRIVKNQRVICDSIVIPIQGRKMRTGNN